MSDSRVQQFVPFKRVGTAISPKISGDGLDIDGQLQGALINNQMVQKATFDILGLMTDPRFLNLQCEDPGAGTMTDVSGQGHDGTYHGSMTTGDRVMKANGWALDLDGVDDYVNLGDHDDFSFGDGNNDEAVTYFGVMEVIDSVATDIILSKADHTSGSELREWEIYLGGAEDLYFKQYDESTNAGCYKYADANLSLGYHSWAITSPGDGGAAAMNNVKIYIDGALVGSTASNSGSYVAMENLSTPCLIGARTYTGGTVEGFNNNDNALTGVDGSEWSAYDVHRFHQIAKGLYGL